MGEQLLVVIHGSIFYKGVELIGLDMYLEKRNKFAEPIDDGTGEKYYKWEEVSYWRKANEIHRWFLDYLNLDGGFNCGHAEIGKEGLQELVDTCKFVLGRKGKNDAIKVAEEKLPTQGGFFFGSIDYDEYYYEDLKYTIKELEKAIQEIDWDNEIVAYSCWW